MFLFFFGIIPTYALSFNVKATVDKDSINAVVLVSVPKMKELQEAYPSYFLNTTEFLMALDTMIENCEKLRWV